jgi:1,2-phenylacetyl-CoA epoxidase catalytic subunit
VRLEALKGSDDATVAGLAAKIDREEVYHRLHAEMWLARLLSTADGRDRLREAVEELWPYALGVLDPKLRPGWIERVQAALPFELPEAEAVPRSQHTDELRELWAEMTMVRRSAPSAQW